VLNLRKSYVLDENQKAIAVQIPIKESRFYNSYSLKCKNLAIGWFHEKIWIGYFCETPKEFEQIEEILENYGLVSLILENEESERFSRAEALTYC